MISVVVPIYNIEHYVARCLDSLAAQMFTDVQFILIDDGSTDQSGKIADQRTTDPRFRVFHTENHGLSAARNLGVEKARGDWLMFVDGDDWVEPDFCRIPYLAALNHDADLVVFRYYSITKKATRIIPQSATSVVTAENAVKYGRTYAWNKLYRKELFEHIRYPEGRVFEDAATTHRLIYSAKRIVMIPDYLYHHTYRKGSISHTWSANYARDAFIAAYDRAADLKGYGCDPSTYEKLLWHCSLGLLLKAEHSNDPLYHKAEEIINHDTGIPDRLKWKKKTMLWIWKNNRPLFHFICRVTGRRDRKHLQNTE